MSSTARYGLTLAAGLLVAASFAACSSDPPTETPAEVDAGSDAPTRRDVGPPQETGGGDTGPSTCQPAITTFTPPAFIPPVGKGLGKCDDGQIQRYLANCLNGTNCAEFEAADAGAAAKDCAACLSSPSASAKWGPAIIYDTAGNWIPNYSGCFDLLGQGTCARDYQAMEQCNDAACLVKCPDEYRACVQTANLGVCKTFADKGDCAANLPKAIEDICYNPNTNGDQDFVVFAKLMCGPPAADAGPADAATDGAADAARDATSD